MLEPDLVLVLLRKDDLPLPDRLEDRLLQVAEKQLLAHMDEDREGK
jgi:hypothetical protein